MVVEPSTPNPPVVVLLQLGVPPAQGTEFVFLVTSRKTQVTGGAVAGFVKLDELQLAKLSPFASEYSTKFAFPWR